MIDGKKRELLLHIMREVYPHLQGRREKQIWMTLINVYSDKTEDKIDRLKELVEGQRADASDTAYQARENIKRTIKKLIFSYPKDRKSVYMIRFTDAVHLDIKETFVSQLRNAFRRFVKKATVSAEKGFLHYFVISYLAFTKPNELIAGIKKGPFLFRQIFIYILYSLLFVVMVLLFFIQRISVPPKFEGDIAKFKHEILSILSFTQMSASIVAILLISLITFASGKLVKSSVKFKEVFSFQLYYWMSWLPLITACSLIVIFSKSNYYKHALAIIATYAVLFWLLIQYSRGIHKLMELSWVRTSLALFIGVLLFGALWFLVFQIV